MCRPILSALSVPTATAPVVRTARSRCSMPTGTSTAKRSPASVSRTPRWRRSNRARPRVFSRSLIRRLAVGWLTRNALTAWWKFRCSTTDRELGQRDQRNAPTSDPWIIGNLKRGPAHSFSCLFSFTTDTELRPFRRSSGSDLRTRHRRTCRASTRCASSFQRRGW